MLKGAYMKIENSNLNVIAVRTSQYPNDGKKEFLLVVAVMQGKVVL